MGFYEYGDEPSGSINGEGFLSIVETPAFGQSDVRANYDAFCTMRSDQMFINVIGCEDKCSLTKHKWNGSCYGVLLIADIQGKKTIQKGQKQKVLFTKITKYSFW